MYPWLFSDPLKWQAKEQVRRLRPLPSMMGSRRAAEVELALLSGTNIQLQTCQF